MGASRRVETWAGAGLGIVVAMAFNLVLAHAAEEGDRTLSQEFHQSYPLNANGSIELTNINGAVHISAWDQNEVKVDAIKRAPDQAELNQMEIEVDAHADSLSIHTKYRNPEGGHEDGNAGEVEYTLSIPRSARLDAIKLVNGSLDMTGVAGEVRASSVNGKLVAHGLAGKVNLSTVNGSIEASFERVGDSPIELSSVNGPVRLMLPSDVKATIDASTVQGEINNDFGLALNQHQFVGHRVRGELGGGGPAIRLRDVNGAIDIAHAS